MSANIFASKLHDKATELYGDGLPQIVSDRIEEELAYAAASGADALKKHKPRATCKFFPIPYAILTATDKRGSWEDCSPCGHGGAA